MMRLSSSAAHHRWSSTTTPIVLIATVLLLLLLIVLPRPHQCSSMFSQTTALPVSMEHWPQVNQLRPTIKEGIAFFAQFASRNYIILHNDSVLSYGRDEQQSFYLLGLGPNVIERTQPTEIVELRQKGVVKLCSSHYHMLALTVTGEVYAWGWNGDGQLGNGFTSKIFFPLKVPLPVKMSDIACGHYSSYALPGLGSEHIYAWGGNNNGQLGLGHLERKVYATEVAVPDVVAIEFAYHLMYTMVLTGAGDVYGWGYGGSRKPEPINVEGKPAIGLAGTWSYGVILAGDGRIYRKHFLRRQVKLFYAGLRRFHQVAGDRGHQSEFLAAESEDSEIVVWRDVRRGGDAHEVIPLANMADAFGIFLEKPLMSFMAAPAEKAEQSLQIRCQELLPTIKYIQHNDYATSPNPNHSYF